MYYARTFKMKLRNDYIHDLIIHEKQLNTTERQSDTTQLAQYIYFSKKKTAWVGFEPT